MRGYNVKKKKKLLIFVSKWGHKNITKIAVNCNLKYYKHIINILQKYYI